MKTRFTSAEIAHVWAHKSAPHREAPSAMSFNSDDFYSYGTVIAKHITFKGKAAVILNETSYGVTTSGHQSHVRQAVRGMQIFRIGGLGMGDTLRDIGGKELFAYAVEQSAECQKKAAKARTNKEHLAGLEAGWLENAQAVNEFFGLRRKVDNNVIARLRASSAAAERKAKLAKEKRAKAGGESLAITPSTSQTAEKP